MLFRGHRKSEWNLTPNLYRRDVHIYGCLSTEEKYQVAEDRMIRAFFDRAVLLLPTFPRSQIIDRVIAQHYGVPTQLLDWTYDPFVGIFFASEMGEPESDGALFFTFPLASKRSDSEFKFPFQGRITQIRPPIIDNRVRVQKSCFTIQSFGGGESFLPLELRKMEFSEPGAATNKKDEIGIMGKVIIPHKYKMKLRGDLMGIGIDSSLLFSDIQGIGNLISERANITNYGGGFDR